MSVITDINHFKDKNDGLSSEPGQVDNNKTNFDFIVKNGINKEAVSDARVQKEVSEIKNSPDMRAIYKLATNFGFTNSDAVNSQDWYYGVYIPHEVRLQCGEDPIHVYADKTEALKVMKQSKKARFKQFRTWKEAAQFAQNGAETTGNSCAVGLEKPVPFKCPKPQDMVRFRKGIECGDIETVKQSIEENPRYLFSSGDTPSILQEGCRYNALHVAAKSKQAAIAELILNSITSLPLLARLFEDPDEEALRQRSQVLLDLYLNTPDKSCNETPLHFAVKYGAVNVVSVLTSYPQCQLGLVNKYGQSVRDLICTRIVDEGGKLKAAILELLEERFFLPVLRSEDNSTQPRIGEPFSPVRPLALVEDRLSPRIEMQAYAGPMSKAQCDEFKKKWRTPPPIMRASALADLEKGLERMGRNVASELKVPWREYWSFLDTFVDLSSPAGLDLLEQYLKRRFDETLNETMSPVVEEKNEDRCSKNDDEILSPISDLCQQFQAFSLAEGAHRAGYSQELRGKRRITKEHDRKIWRKEKSFARKLEEVCDESPEGGVQFSPLLCVERSCQVFGKRIANSLFHVTSSYDTNKLNADALKNSLDPEIKHLLSLITSYIQDPRFSCVEFRLVHTRVAAIAGSSLRQLMTPNELTSLKSCLREIDLTDGTVSDDEDLLFSTRESEVKSQGAIVKAHVLCLTQCLLAEITSPSSSHGSITNEVECEVLWSRAIPCSCAWDARSHVSRARSSWRRKPKMLSKKLTYKSDDEKSSVEDSWRSCEEPPLIEEDEEFGTPPSSPSDDDVLEDTLALPDTFIYSGNRPSKTDLSVLDAIKDCKITACSHPAIYRWRHLVKLHEDEALPTGQIAPSPGAWNRRRIALLSPSPRPPETAPESPQRASWERVTGIYTPRRRILNTSSPAR